MSAGVVVDWQIMKQPPSIESLKLRLREFAAKRDWDQFHSPKNLAMALSVEVAELVELFQWLSEDESRQLPQEVRAEVAKELADAQNYLIRLADKLEIDLLSAAEAKIVENEGKYPAEKVKGSAKKYTAYEDGS